MNLPSLSDLAGLLSAWAQDTRLHALAATHAEQPLPADLMVERFELHEAVSQPFELCIHVLTLDTHVALKELYARPVTLTTRLSDGSEVSRTGVVTEARSLQSDGGFARKALLLQPWVALLDHALCSRVWQDASAIQIVEDVFADHPQLAAWHWNEGVADHVARGLFARNGGQRSYCVQHRESDLEFIQRLLAEEGIAWRVEEHADAPMGHRLVFFVQSDQQPEDPTSAHSLGGRGIRFHGNTSQQEQDSITALAARRELRPTQLVLQGWDHKANQAIVAEVPTAAQWGPDEAMSLNDWLHSYDPTGDFVCANQAEATFLATLLQQAHEARHKTWFGRGSVRSLRAGTWAGVTQSTVGLMSGLASSATSGARWGASAGISDRAGDAHELFFTQVHAVGVNNLPKDIQALIDASLPHPKGRFARPRWPMLERPRGFEPEVTGAINTEPLHAHAEHTGFACQFQAVRRDVPWRPVLMDDTGLRPRPRPTALGPQTAIVVGPDGSEHPSGAHELHTDKMGRVKVRFHWQNIDSPQRRPSDHSCWLRVVQRLSGPGMGHQFIPRIGQEVLVTFLGNDIDRPVVMAALYNGQGESGIAPTPGGAAAESTLDALAQSTDHTPASQGNLIGSGAGGHSPPWHGAASAAATPGAQGQANAAALSGIKSKEFGGSGHNQLVWDDTPEQLRTQLHTTQAQTWLQIGHLLQQHGNQRLQPRGHGLEFHTQAQGALRAARGLHLSTHARPGGTTTRAQPLDTREAEQQLQAHAELLQTLHANAQTHKAQLPGEAAPEQLPARKALGATLSSLQATEGGEASASGATDADEADTGSASGGTSVPIGGGQGRIDTSERPDLVLSASGDIASTTPASTLVATGANVSITTGQDTNLLAQRHQAWAVKDGISLFTRGEAKDTQRAVQGTGIQLHAASGNVRTEAQSGPFTLTAQKAVDLQSTAADIVITAPERIVLNGGGGYVKIEGGNIEIGTGGAAQFRAAAKELTGGGSASGSGPALNKAQDLFDEQFVLKDQDTAAVLAGTPYRIENSSGEVVAAGITDADGRTSRVTSSKAETLKVFWGQ